MSDSDQTRNELFRSSASSGGQIGSTQSIDKKVLVQLDGHGAFYHFRLEAETGHRSII